MKNKKILLAGGAGFIGQELAARWGRDNEIIILSRQQAHSPNNTYGRKSLQAKDGYSIRYLCWDGRQVADWAGAVEGCDLVVDLAGRSVNCRYTARNRREIFDSRTDATQAIGEAVRRVVVPPKLWVNIASATIYRINSSTPHCRIF